MIMEPELEALLAKLDLDWTQGNPSFDILIAKAKTLGINAVLELCAADLEWRWRKFGNKKIGRADSTPLTARDYWPHFVGLAEDTNSRLAILQTEWLARSKWGDRPRIDAFLKDNEYGQANRSTMLESLNVVANFELTLSSHSPNPFSIPLPVQLVIGRQMIEEPSPPIYSPETNRLILWPLEQVMVSRKQLRLERSRAFELRITNISDSRSIEINGQLLNPLKAQYLWMPSDITIAEVPVRIRSIDM